MNILVGILLHVLLTGAIPVQQEDSVSIDSSSVYEVAEADSTRQKPVQFMLLPIIFKSPDTGLAFGVLPQAVFRTSSSGNPSSIRMDSYYTQKKQYHMLLRSRYWLSEDAGSLTGKVSLKKWPTGFYGIGRYASTDNNEKFTETLIEANIEGTRRIRPGLFAGIGYGFRYGRIEADELNGTLQSGTIPGSGNTRVSGISTVIQVDTRNNHFFPSSGSYHRAEVFTSLKPLGSDYGFTLMTLDLRHYVSLHPNHVLAVQATGMASTGTVPFRMLPSVGSTLRGYSTVRHIDRNLVTLQLEYRVVPVAWRLGFVVFGGVGEVLDHPKEIRMNNLKFAAGIGLRYHFSRSEKINIRIDYGIGRDSSGDYIDLNEAF